VKAKERQVARFGFLRAFRGDRGSAMGTVHQPILLIFACFRRMSITEVWALCQGAVCEVRQAQICINYRCVVILCVICLRYKRSFLTLMIRC
jgi:hypothetical protein